MTEDATLEDFVGGESGDRDAPADGGEGEAGGEDGTGTEAEEELRTAEDRANAGTDDRDDVGGDVDPAATTYAWGRERTCADCGETVRRCWRDGDGFVCPDCKTW